MTILETLIAARSLIADESRWCIGSNARSFKGDKLIDAQDPQAATWCAVGALLKVVPSGDFAAAEEALFFLHNVAHDYFGEIPSSVNDLHGHSEVMRMYDKAIRILQANGG